MTMCSKLGLSIKSVSLDWSEVKPEQSKMLLARLYMVENYIIS